MNVPELLRRLALLMIARRFIILLLKGRINSARLSRNILTLLLSFVTSILVGWLLIENEDLLRDRHAASDQAKRAATRLSVTSRRQKTADDLTAIDGIGATYARVLTDAGITSFATLAEQNPETLSDKLDNRVSAQRIRNDDWIGQARQLTRQ
jgi:predicted flap endonuclease-1-like 5' DNA nuclease